MNKRCINLYKGIALTNFIINAMFWPFNHKAETSYWLKVFGLYVLVEASIQLMFLILLNNFGGNRISILEFHLVMLLFQCLLIWPIWWIAYAFRKQAIFVQVIVNVVFYIAYSYLWFGLVQDAIGYIYNHLQQITRPVWDRQEAYLDRGYEYSYLNYQLLKHAFRLSWFYLATYFYHYRQEEKKRIALAVANKDLQLKMLKWHLNPSFYFKTINHLQQVAQKNPVSATEPILQLAKVMEYVIYETKEKLISVKKELQFLDNYTGLINQQERKNCFKLKIEGEYQLLRISPLILTAIIDKLLDGVSKNDLHYELQIQFNGNEMLVKIEGNENKTLFDAKEEIYRRFQELYPDKFTINQSERLTTISLILDEAG